MHCKNCILFKSNPLELIVDFLIKDQDHPVHVIHPDVIRPPQIVLDKADNTTGPLVPSVVVTRAFTAIHLRVRRG